MDYTTSTTSPSPPLVHQKFDVSAIDATLARIDATMARADQSTLQTNKLEDDWRQFQAAFVRMNEAFAARLSDTTPMVAAGGGFGYAEEIHVPQPWMNWHGRLGCAEWPLPRCIFSSASLARPGYCDNVDRSEYLDESDVLDAKVTLLARLIKVVAERSQGQTVVYAGAGISTSVKLMPAVGNQKEEDDDATSVAPLFVPSGIPDYASSTSGSSGVTEATKKNKMTKSFLLRCLPSPMHRLITFAIQDHSPPLFSGVLNQNHDGLFQRAGLDSKFVNEIHGGVFDPRNPVVKMSAKLRPSNAAWMMEMVKTAKLVVVVGTSLSGMASDGIVRAASRRFLAPVDDDKKQNVEHNTNRSKSLQHQQQQRKLSSHSPSSLATSPSAAIASSRLPSLPEFDAARGFGACIVNIQKTQLDMVASLRIFAKLDDVAALLATKLGVPAAATLLSSTRVFDYPASPYIFTHADGKEIPDERVEVVQSEKLATVLNKMSSERKTEVLRKLTEHCSRKSAESRREKMDDAPSAQARSSSKNLRPFVGAEENATESSSCSPAGGVNSAAAAAPAKLSFVQPASVASTAASLSSAAPARAAAGAPPPAAPKNRSSPGTTATTGSSSSLRRSPPTQHQPTTAGSRSPSQNRRSPSSTSSATTAKQKVSPPLSGKTRSPSSVNKKSPSAKRSASISNKK